MSLHNKHKSKKKNILSFLRQNVHFIKEENNSCKLFSPYYSRHPISRQFHFHFNEGAIFIHTNSTTINATKETTIIPRLTKTESLKHK